MKKHLAIFALAAMATSAFAADTTLRYVNFDNVPVAEMSAGIPASTGLVAAYNSWGFPAVLYPDLNGMTKRNPGDANEKVLRFRDSDSYNYLFATEAPTDVAWDVADQRVSFYGYARCDFITTAECDFGVTLRQQQNGVPGADGSTFARTGYYACFASKNSSWGSFYPADYAPFALTANSGWTQLCYNETSKLSSTDGWHFYSAEMVGNKLKMYIDGLVVAEGTDSTYAKGYPMVWVYWDDQTSNASGWSTLGIEELKFETITAFSGVSDWSQF